MPDHHTDPHALGSHQGPPSASAQCAAGGAEASEFPPLSVGQRVFVHFNRWTPDGWVQVRAEATVINPCVTGDGVYDGDVEYKTPGTLSREFSSRHNVEVVDEHA